MIKCSHQRCFVSVPWYIMVCALLPLLCLSCTFCRVWVWNEVNSPKFNYLLCNIWGCGLQLTHLSFDDCENSRTSSCYHNQIGNLNHWSLCLGLGHETMVRAEYLIMFYFIMTACSPQRNSHCRYKIILPSFICRMSSDVLVILLITQWTLIQYKDSLSAPELHPWLRQCRIVDMQLFERLLIYVHVFKTFWINLSLQRESMCSVSIYFVKTICVYVVYWHYMERNLSCMSSVICF